ncbi:hypothetical protein MFIFM68171_06537 [Madurella fahalii]|uniref:Uncharacterized protein n=1 Tax=Madurella fahalii TaxID=1157608 RepID=A0ABQ0GEZ8_9PEZI
MTLFIIHLLLVFSIIRQADALAFFGRRPSQNNGTTLALGKRQGTAIATVLATIFESGDGSMTRTANPGFDIRVDLLNDLFGFCPTTVITATDCGLAGSCVDGFGCLDGCGFTDRPLTTFTCSQSNEPFCSIARLTLSGNIGPFTYIGCGRTPTTVEYYAFTTEPTSSSPSTIQETTSLPSQTPSTLPSATISTPRAPSGTDTPANSASSGTGDGGGGTPPDNTGAIIGGVVGCVALLCVCGVAIAWIMRRNKGSKVPTVAPASGPEPASEYMAEQAAYKNGGWMPRELSVGPDNMPPTELPAPSITPVELPGYYPNGGR